MQVWKSVAESSSDPAKQLSLTIFLQKARELYQEYGKNSKRPTWSMISGGQDNHKISRLEELTNVAALIS